MGKNADTTINTRINSTIKTRAAKVFAANGLTISAVIRLLLTRTAKEQRVPFDLVSKTGESIEMLEK